MQPSPLYWFLSTLVFAGGGLVVGSGVYFALRAIEKWNRRWTQSLSIFGSIFLLLTIKKLVFFFMPFVLPISVVVGVIGAIFHQKSAKQSKTLAEALLLMMLALLVTMRIEFQIVVPFLLLSPITPAQFSSSSSTIAHLFLLLAPIALMPFLVWCYQNSRLRPGIDRHREKGEELEPLL